MERMRRMRRYLWAIRPLVPIHRERHNAYFPRNITQLSRSSSRVNFSIPWALLLIQSRMESKSSVLLKPFQLRDRIVLNSPRSTSGIGRRDPQLPWVISDMCSILLWLFINSLLRSSTSSGMQVPSSRLVICG